MVWRAGLAPAAMAGSQETWRVTTTWIQRSRAAAQAVRACWRASRLSWRAVWAAMPNNPVMAARFEYLTTRQDNRLARQQARTACAAALLRWIHVVVTRHVAWDPAIAAGTSPARRSSPALTTRG